MSTRVDVEEIESTKSEKLLAVVLAIFFLIGGIWTYQKIDDSVADWLAPSEVELSAEDEAARTRFNEAQDRMLRADEAQDRAEENLVLAREAYRTALDAGRPAEELEQAYEQAQAEHERAQANLTAATRDVEAARPAAAEIASRHAGEIQRERQDRHELAAFLFRLGLVLALLALGYWLLGRMRTRRSRYLPTAIAFVASTALLALLMAGDYVTDYVDPVDLGPLVLSLAGIVITLFAFAALQRYLAKRVPIRRVRKQQCPFCGYPVRGNEHCEGCGRPVLAECASCSSPRRVGTLHCGVCGHA